MKLTKAKAKELSIKKWEYIVGNGGREEGLYNVYPEMKLLKCGCALCERFILTQSKRFGSCFECPIRPKLKEYDDLEWSGCLQDLHPYSTWLGHGTKENAQAVLDLIKKS